MSALFAALLGLFLVSAFAGFYLWVGPKIDMAIDALTDADGTPESQDTEVDR